MVVGFCECGNESLDFIKGREFLDQLSDSWFLKDFVPHVVNYIQSSLHTHVYLVNKYLFHYEL
jgi:hypothetical protein